MLVLRGRPAPLDTLETLGYLAVFLPMGIVGKEALFRLVALPPLLLQQITYPGLRVSLGREHHVLKMNIWLPVPCFWWEMAEEAAGEGPPGVSWREGPHQALWSGLLTFWLLFWPC